MRPTKVALTLPWLCLTHNQAPADSGTDPENWSIIQGTVVTAKRILSEL